MHRGSVQDQLASEEVERASTCPAPDDQHAPGRIEESRTKTAESSFLLQLAIGRSTRDKLRYAQALLSHSVRPDDVAQVLDRALDVLIAKLERQKIGADPERPPRERKATERPTQSTRT